MKDLIQRKLNEYKCKTPEEEQQALREISQEVMLYGLFKAGFFEKALFHGGTCLRIFFGLERFSEDLDFTLMTPNQDFEVDSYLSTLCEEVRIYGFDIEVSGQDRADVNVRKRFLKDNSIKRLLDFKHQLDARTKLKIKLEVDICPPQGAQRTIEYLKFPLDVPIALHDLPTLFAGKCHALLCRDYIKGRDWYDLLWYLRNNCKPNYTYLSHALSQLGPWKEKKLQVSPSWLKNQLQQKIENIDWNMLKLDLGRFLKQEQREQLQFWSKDLFLKRIASL